MPASRLLPLVLTVLAGAAAGCGGDAGGAATGPRVVATTPHLADLARAVARDRAEVTQLIPSGADAHDYELRPRDVRALASADLVLRSGGDVDEWLGDAMAAAGGDPRVVTLLDRVRRRGDDPHWWQDPRNAVVAVRAIADELSAADPAGRAAYAAAARVHAQRIAALDRAVARCLGRLPPGGRKLVTTHDALGYFAARYGLQVVGTVIPARSTQAQPSSRDLADLIALVERERVRAIFTETSLAPGLERTLARETGATAGEPLYTDSLGPKGSPGATYLGALAHNARAIVRGAGGDPAACEPRGG